MIAINLLTENGENTIIKIITVFDKIHIVLRNKMKVSVIIPVYNAENHIENCLYRTLNQNFQDFEIIFVDDCSKDNTVKIIREKTANDKRVKLFTLNENHRQGYARNIGLQNATGDYVMFFDADDDYSQDYIAKMYEKIVKDKSDITACKFSVIDEKTNTPVINHGIAMFSDYPQKSHNGFCYADVPLLDLFNKSNTIWDKIYKRDFLVKNNIIFPTNLFNKEDDVFAFRTLFQAKKISVLNETLYFYKINPEKYDSQFKKESIYDCFLMFDLIKNDLQKTGLFEELKFVFMKYEVFTLKYYYCILEQDCHEDFFYKLQTSYQKYKNVPDEIKKADNVMFELIDKIIETKEFSKDIDDFLKNF